MRGPRRCDRRACGSTTSLRLATRGAALHSGAGEMRSASRCAAPSPRRNRGRSLRSFPLEVVPAARKAVGLFATPGADELPVLLREALLDLFFGHHRVGLPVGFAVEAPEKEVRAR